MNQPILHTEHDFSFPASAHDYKSDAGPSDAWVSGAPYVQPAFVADFDANHGSVDVWDRLVLIGGGVVLGFSLGFVAVLCLLMNAERINAMILWSCLSTVILNVAVCGALIYYCRRRLSALPPTRP